MSEPTTSEPTEKPRPPPILVFRVSPEQKDKLDKIVLKHRLFWNQSSALRKALKNLIAEVEKTVDLNATPAWQIRLAEQLALEPADRHPFFDPVPVPAQPSRSEQPEH